MREYAEETDIDDEVCDQQLQTLDDPLAAVVVVLARERVLSEQIGPSAAATPTMLDPWLAAAKDLPARESRHP